MDKDLKDIWQSVGTEEPIEEQKVDFLLKQKSNGVLDRLLITMKHEYKVVKILYPLIVIGLLFFKIFIASALFLTAFVALIFYYEKILSLLKRKSITLNTHDYLKSTYRRLKKYIKYYKYIGLTFVFLSFIAGLEYGEFFDKILAKFHDMSLENIWIIIALYFALVSVFLIFFIVFTNFKYGKRLKKLKALIDELEDES